MADSSVLLEVIVEGKNIKIVQREVEELASSINKTTESQSKNTDSQKKNTKATKDLNNETRNYNKGQKGVAQATANGTKAFSKQRDAMGGGSSGLVGAYATLAANLFAATALFGALRSAAQIESLVSGVTALGAASGTNIVALAENLKAATENAISLEQALRTASFGISSGFSGDQLNSLVEVGKKAAIALGRDAGDAVDRLTRGVAKLEPEILDELGIIARLDDATRKYAASIGKTQSQLTSYERQQAFANEVIQQGLDKFKDVDGAPNPYDKLSASLNDLAKAATGIINTVLSPLASFFSENKLALLGFIAVLSKGVINAALPVLNTMSKAAKEALTETNAAVKSQAEAFAKKSRVAKDALTNFTYLSKEEKMFANQIKVGNTTIKEQTSFIEKLTARLRQRQAAIKEGNSLSATTVKKYNAEIKALEALIPKLEKVAAAEKNRSRAGAGTADLMAATADQKYAERTSKALDDLDANPSLSNYTKKLKDSLAVGAQYRKSTDESRKANEKFSGALGFLPGVLAKGSAAFKSFGLTAKIAIKGIFTAIPIIGQILFIIDMAVSALVGFINMISNVGTYMTTLSASSKKLDDALGAVSNTTNKLSENSIKLNAEYKRLDRKIATTTDSLKKEELQLRKSTLIRKERVKALVGEGTALKDTITALEEYNATAAAIREEASSLSGAIMTIAKLFGDIGKQFANIANLIYLAFAETFNRLIYDIKNLGAWLDKTFGTNIFAVTEDSLKEQGDLVRKLRSEWDRTFTGAQLEFLQEGLRASRGEADTLIEIFEAGGEAASNIAKAVYGDVVPSSTALSGAFYEVMNSGIEGAQGVTKEFIDLAKAADANGNGFIDTAEKADLMAAVIEKATSNQRGLSEGIKSSQSALKDFSTQYAALFDSQKASNNPFEEFLSSVAPLQSSLKDLIEGTEKFAAAPLDVIQGVLDTLTKEQKKLLGVEGDLTEESFDRLQNNLKILQTAGQSLRYEKSRLKLITDITKVTKEYNSVSTGALKQTLKLEQQQADVKIKSLDDQIQAQKLLVESSRVDGEADVQLSNKLVELEYDRNILSSERISDRRIELELGAASLALATRAYEVYKQEQQTAAARLENEQRINNLLSGRGSDPTAAQNAEASIKAAEISYINAAKELEFTGIRLDLERQILDAKLQGANATIKAANASLPEGEKQSLIDIEGILGGFDKTAALTMASAKDAVNAAFENLQSERLNAIGSLMAAPMENQINRYMAAVENASAAAAAMSDAISMKKPVEGAVSGATTTAATIAEGALTTASSNSSAGPMEEVAVTGQAETGMASIITGAAQARTALAPFFEDLSKLGPEGELISAIGQGAIQMSESFASLGQAINEGGDVTTAALGAAASAISAIGAMQQASSKQKIAAIDGEIAAEKKRDGKSKESLARIAGLEKKKEATARKAFEQNKKMQMASAAISTAAAIAGQLSAQPVGPWNIALAAMMGVLGAAQISMISSQQYNGGGSSSPSMPTSISLGERKSSVDMAKSQSTSGELAYMRGAMGTGGAENFKPAFTGAKYRATGGPTAGYVVGEQGPELFVPQMPGNIVPNSEVSQQTPTNVNFTISALDASGVEDILVKQRGNIIGMVREAANSYGQTFLEGVDTSSYTQTAGGVTKY